MIRSTSRIWPTVTVGRMGRPPAALMGPPPGAPWRGDPLKLIDMPSPSHRNGELLSPDLADGRSALQHRGGGGDPRRPVGGQQALHHAEDQASDHLATLRLEVCPRSWRTSRT